MKRASCWKPGVCRRCGEKRHVSTKKGRCYHCTAVVAALRPRKSQVASYDEIPRIAPKWQAERDYHGRVE